MSLLDKASLIVTPNAYKESKLYSVVPNTTLGDMDVVRATTATRVNSAGLIEVVPRNLVTYSNDISNAAWVKVSGSGGTTPIVTSNYAISPSGLTDATRVQLARTTASGSFSVIRQAITILPNTNYRQSVWLKSLSGTPSILIADNGAAFVNLVTLTTEWVRYDLPFTNTVNFCNFDFALSQSIAGSSLTADFLVYGAQLDQGSTATEYFPTTTRLNIPRIDYTNGSCPSLLVEPQRTNLLLYSEQFDNAYWAKASTTITSNNTTAPDGNTTADRLVLTGASSTSRVISRNIPITTVTTTVTFSTFVKYIDKQYLQLTFGLGFSSDFANFDLINGTLVGGTYGNAKIKNYSNGWYRISITSTGLSTITCTAFIWAIDSAAALRAADSTSTGTSAYLIWGAQLEEGGYPTSYIPTVASTVTRNADVISKTGISSLIGTTYTVYGEIINEGIHNARHLALKLPTGGNYTDVVFIVQNFNGLQATANNSTSTAQFTINSGSYSIGQTLKYALRCEQNNVAFYINGVQIGVDTLCTIPAVSTLYLGTYVDLQLGSKIKSTMIFPSALTNDELAQLTTL